MLDRLADVRPIAVNPGVAKVALQIARKSDRRPVRARRAGHLIEEIALDAPAHLRRLAGCENVRMIKAGQILQTLRELIAYTFRRCCKVTLQLIGERELL